MKVKIVIFSENLEVYTFQSLFGYHVILGGWQIQSKQRKAITTLSGNHLCLLLSQSEDKRKVHLSFQPEWVENQCGRNLTTKPIMIQFSNSEGFDPTDLCSKVFLFCSSTFFYFAPTNLVSLSPPITEAYQPLKLIENRSLGIKGPSPIFRIRRGDL